ncbi:GRAM domain-containing protein 4 [Acipenser ruthenus]|uniref:GRAM domain-containing protein 4 n=1 Tax=Acipenser ruthenus TaxID=7906 RepID=A0A444UEA3_ACIRT|nr:GRAM domain-containing protein 4 [Acipenser ruthenus]
MESDRLNEIKGHLEIALLEKHFLQEELRKLREETNVETLKQELDKERIKRIELEQKVNELLKTRAEESAVQQPTKVNGTEKRVETVYSRFQKWLYDKFGVYIEDFRFQPEENTVETEEPLSAKRLTENMRRLNLHECCVAWLGHPYVPLFSHFEVILKLPHCKEPPKEDLTVSEKFQLVLDVAQKAQNLFGKMADVLEKIKNLFMWVQPEITQKLYIGLWVAFIASSFLPFKLVGFLMGVYAGIKFFIIDFIFKRCPKLRDKYDTPYIVWTNLPTDPQLKERTNATVSRRYKVLSVLPGSGMGISIATPSTQKPLVFGAMIHRDEAFEMIFTQYMKIMSAASISET